MENKRFTEVRINFAVPQAVVLKYNKQHLQIGGILQLFRSDI